MTQEDRDKSLIDSCLLHADEGGWEEFVRSYSRLIWSAIHKTFLAYSFVSSREDSEDVFNGIFLSLLDNDFKKLRQFSSRNSCTLSTWLTVVSINQTIDHIRKESRRTRVIVGELDKDGHQVPDRNPDIETILMQQQADTAVASAIASLSRSDREVYELLFTRNLHPDRAASALGISVTALYTRKHRLIEKIRQKMVSL